MADQLTRATEVPPGAADRQLTVQNLFDEDWRYYINLFDGRSGDFFNQLHRYQLHLMPATDYIETFNVNHLPLTAISDRRRCPPDHDRVAYR